MPGLIITVVRHMKKKYYIIVWFFNKYIFSIITFRHPYGFAITKLPLLYVVILFSPSSLKPPELLLWCLVSKLYSMMSLKSPNYMSSSLSAMLWCSPRFSGVLFLFNPSCFVGVHVLYILFMVIYVYTVCNTISISDNYRVI